MQYLWKPEEGGGASGSGVKDSCWLPCERGELNPSPLEEQLLLLTAKPSLQPCDALFLPFPISLKLFQNKKGLQCDKVRS